MIRRLTFLLALIVTFVPLRTSSAQEGITGLPGDVVRVKVSSYVDGDKIKVALDGERVELNFIGADAPEPGECYVGEANDAMRALLAKGTPLYLERDEDDKDGKDRLLRHVWADDGDGGAYLVNAKLIRDGIAGWKAKDAEGGNAKYAGRYEKAEADAKARGNGLWSECDRLHSQARTKSEQTAGAERATEAANVPEPTAVPVPTDVPVVEEPVVEAPIGIGGNCDPSYPTICVPSFPDLNCPDVAVVDFPVQGADPHGFDRDRDGIGCES